MRKSIIRAYLLLFIAGILGWLITSSLGFYAGVDDNMPSWMASWPPLSRVLFLTLTSNSFYIFIALGLFIEFFKPAIELKWSGNKWLSALGLILIINALVVGAKNGLFFGGFENLLDYNNNLIDTVIYGLGFGTLFFLSVPQRTFGLSLALWTRLIEVGGFAIGYFFVPGIFSQWPEGYALGHMVYGPAFMFTNYFFLTDNITAIGSLLGVVYLLYKFKFKLFWITSFFIGAIIVGYNIARYVIANF